jgi:15-cis-phytoene synthase
VARGARGDEEGTAVSDRQLSMAYAVCRGVARAQARNFYYAFLVLPRDKRDALCAVYAFMRHADDLTDDPGLDPPQRHQKLVDWYQALERASQGERSDDPIIFATGDTQRRYNIPLAYFEQLVAGTAMDLDFFAHPAADAPIVLYPTFDDLYRYCYHVASVVGLVCMHIFGFPHAETARAQDLAIKTGIAFQLTNIVRDVREYAAMGRVYLPAEDLQRFGHDASQLTAKHLANGFNPAPFVPLLKFEADRAREYYAAAEQLIPLVEEDSRACLWALVTIYRRLLERIAARNYDVFTEKVRVPVHEKLAVLSRGLLKAVF